MKLNSIEPNAHYDIAHGMPAVLEKDNDGSVIYRVNIAEEKAIPEGENEARPIGWSCYEVRTFAKPTKANLKRVFIRSVIDETAEFDLVIRTTSTSLALRRMKRRLPNTRNI